MYSWIYVSGTTKSANLAEKASFCIFPGNFTGYAMQAARRVPPLFHFCFSLFFYKQHRQSFASCAPTVRKLNERLQLCSPPLQPATLGRGCLFYKFIIGTTLRGIAKLTRSPAYRIRFLRLRTYPFFSLSTSFIVVCSDLDLFVWCLIFKWVVWFVVSINLKYILIWWIGSSK